uniref:Tripartite motif containing 58 n=1 Tax=Pseudonaja textilis TaxID=8673 RepID=A0A670YRZ0_PSETE
QPCRDPGGISEYLPDAATCTLCMRVFHEPVTLNCGHNYCHACIQKHWGGAQSNVACPQCHQRSGGLKQLPGVEGSPPLPPAMRAGFRKGNKGCPPPPRIPSLPCGTKVNGYLDSDSQQPEQSWRDSDLAPLVCVAVPPPFEANVTMDRLTAHPHLLLSASKKIVTHDATPSGLLPGRQAFDTTPCILAEKGFTGGRHCWQVEVASRGRGWAFGVMKDSVSRKGPVGISTDEGIWALLPEHLPPAEPELSICSFRLYLDYEGGTIHFFDGVTREPVALLSYAVFLGERVFPFFKLEEPSSQMCIVP